MKYKFSQQQILGINYYYSKLVDNTFDEDDVRLLLIHLREFLLNNDNLDARGRHNAGLLLEFGNSAVHTIRDRYELYERISELVQKLARAGADWSSIPFALLEPHEIIFALRDSLLETGVLYRPEGIEDVFERNSFDLTMCLTSMLHGMLFKIKYPGISNDFYVVDEAGEHFLHVRTELDLSDVTSLRLAALIPRYGGGTLGQWVLCCKLSGSDKVQAAALKRTGSSEGYCEPIKALRVSGKLMITTVPTGASALEVYKVFRASSYDTHPISKGIPLTKLT
jgi:hypothetical protein